MAENAELLSLTIQDDEDMLAWSVRVKDASSKFVDMGGDFTEPQKVMLLFIGLIPVFRSPRDTLLNEARKTCLKSPVVTTSTARTTMSKSLAEVGKTKSIFPSFEECVQTLCRYRSNSYGWQSRYCQVREVIVI